MDKATQILRDMRAESGIPAALESAPFLVIEERTGPDGKTATRIDLTRTTRDAVYKHIGAAFDKVHTAKAETAHILFFNGIRNGKGLPLADGAQEIHGTVMNAANGARQMVQVMQYYDAAFRSYAPRQ